MYNTPVHIQHLHSSKCQRVFIRLTKLQHSYRIQKHTLKFIYKSSEARLSRAGCEWLLIRFKGIDASRKTRLVQFTLRT